MIIQDGAGSGYRAKVTSENNLEVLPIFKALGGRVRHFGPDADLGRLRYYVNDRRFCLFVRTPDDAFFGLIGDDPLVIDHLKADFLNEWESLAADA